EATQPTFPKWTLVPVKSAAFWGSWQARSAANELATGVGTCRKRTVRRKCESFIRLAEAARPVGFGDACPSWQRRISTDCAPSPGKSSIRGRRYREGRRVR